MGIYATSAICGIKLTLNGVSQCVKSRNGFAILRATSRLAVNSKLPPAVNYRTSTRNRRLLQTLLPNVMHRFGDAYEETCVHILQIHAGTRTDERNHGGRGRLHNRLLLTIAGGITNPLCTKHDFISNS